ncbi:hypothetical protein U5640_04130 [Streptomyces sp. SS7]
MRCTAPDAASFLLDGSHFLLESALDEAAALIRAFLTADVRTGRRIR